jgi:uncharacterized RDD family membrane protein YckC
VETPEGIDLHAELAGLVPRALAYTTDFLIRGGVLLVLSILVTFLGAAGVGVYMIAFFLLEWAYPVFFEVYRGGQTPGKKAYAIRVVNDDLTPVRLNASLLRNLLRTADFLPVFYFFGSISMLSTERFQRLGDIAAKTIVVYQTNVAHDLSVLNGVSPRPISANLNSAQQAAFVRFALSKNSLSVGRQKELADIIAEKIPPGYSNRVEWVRGVGKWLVGAK